MDNPETMEVMKQFYKNSTRIQNKEKFIVGINPSRHGAGVTGVPFTDICKTGNICAASMDRSTLNEISSVFVLIRSVIYSAFRFYKQFT